MMVMARCCRSYAPASTSASVIVEAQLVADDAEEMDVERLAGGALKSIGECG